MFKKLPFYCMVFILFVMQIPAFGLLNLELTQGIKSAIPIAIVPFKNPTNLSTDITKIVTNDLKNSGQFKMADTQLLKQFPHTLKAVDYSYWRDFNVDDLVIGQVIPEKDNNYQVHINLLAIYKNSLYKHVESQVSGIMGAGENPILLDENFDHIHTNQLRALGHHISDLIYKKLTGVRGIFSTRIAYILVEHNQYGQPVQFSLEVADADGYNPRPILISPEPILSPAWSPDGKEIAYVSLEKDRSAVYVSNIATGKRELIAHFSGMNSAPAWSPDGKKMALVLSKTGSPKIYLVDLQTKQMKQLTHGWSIDTEPAFSPDGQTVIFTSDRDGSPQIYSTQLTSHLINRLTFVGNYNARASFTPDGKSIVMLHRDQGKFNIAIQDLNTGNVTVLSHQSDDQSPSVSPNGKMIIYASHEGDQGILGMVSTDGQVSLKIPASDGVGTGHDLSVREPVWGPFLD